MFDIYLATPYTHESKDVMEARFNRACQLTASFMSRGIAVFCPIVHSHPLVAHGLPQCDHDFWMALDEKGLDACLVLVVAKMDGWVESRGVQHEIRIAQETGKQIVYLTEQEIIEGV